MSEGEYSRATGSSDPDLWAAAAHSWAERQMPYQRAYALMREGEATLHELRNRARAAGALRLAHDVAVGLGATPLVTAIEAIGQRALIDLSPQADVPPRPENRVTRVPEPLHRGRYELTPREREVLGLLAAGLSDGDIARELFISKKTASVHVAAIKGKLGSRSRVEIVTDAIALGLHTLPQRSHS